MKIILTTQIRKYVSNAGVFLITAALIAGMAGCPGFPPCPTPPPSKNLEIRTWYDLDDVRNNLAGNHTLMNDLDSTTSGYTELASPTANGGKGWEPIGNHIPMCPYGGFTGTFDGQGYEIRDLYINRPDEYLVGLFGYIEHNFIYAKIIKAIGVVNSTVTGANYVGGLVGRNWGTVSESYSTGSVTGNWRVGGLVGANDGTVSNSYSTCNVTGYSHVGGLVGNNGYYDTVSKSYSTGSVSGVQIIGGLVGHNDTYGIVSNSFWDTETSGQANSDGGTGKNTTEMQDITTFSGAGWNITTVGGIGERNITCIWNIVNGVTYPFLSWQSVKIRDWYDLDAIRNDLDGSYVLMNNLNSTTPGYTELASPTANGGKGWEPIGNFTGGNFTGSFDGQRYEIRDLFINRPDEYCVGLFSTVGEGGRIEDIGVVNATVTGGYYVGSLVVFNWNGTVNNSYSTGTVNGKVTGGLVGVNGGVVSDCYSAAIVNGNWFVGGLVGRNADTVSESYSTGNVTGDNFAGGLVGNNIGNVSNSYSTSSVTGNNITSGLVGGNAGTVSNSYSTGSVTGNWSVGGLVGASGLGSNVTNSFWDTQTSGQNVSYGGTGKNTTEMQDIVTFSGAGWDIIGVVNPSTRNTTYIWNIVDNVTYPFLSWQS